MSEKMEKGDFVPQGDAFEGAKKELMSFGVSEVVLSQAEQIQVGEDLPIGVDEMVLRREGENSYRIGRVESFSKEK